MYAAEQTCVVNTPKCWLWPADCGVVCEYQGGSVIQLHHKVLQSYLVAEGLFGDCLTEDGL